MKLQTWPTHRRSAYCRYWGLALLPPITSKYELVACLQLECSNVWDVSDCVREESRCWQAVGSWEYGPFFVYFNVLMFGCSLQGVRVRLRWVWYRYPFLGLPMMHVLVVTHLFGCVEIRDNSFIHFLARRRLNLGLVASPWNPWFPI